MNISVVCGSTGNHEAAVMTWIKGATLPWQIMVDATVEGKGAGYIQKLEKGYRETTGDIIAYFHNDLFIHTPGWDQMVLKEFESPDVAVAGFFGAKQHGRGDIYRASYDFRQLARADCVSNMVDAEVHGRRVTEPCDIAVIDSLACIVRRSFLDQIGGWVKSGLLESHTSDYWICLMAHRHKMRVRYVPVSCTHHSGGVRGDGRFDYPKWQEWYGYTDSQMHQINHRKLYDEFRDVLPVRIP